MPAVCAICEIRRPRRYCPGVRGDICSICCGTERESTVTCPIDCKYLQEAHDHEWEKDMQRPPQKAVHEDIRLDEDFLERHQVLIAYLGRSLCDSAQNITGTYDADLRDALESLIQSYRTREGSGLIYNARPDNALAANLQADLEASIRALEDQLKSRSTGTIRDSEYLGALVFLRRLNAEFSNERPKSRAFMDWLNRSLPQSTKKKEDSILL